MLTPSELEAMPKKLEKYMSELEMRIMQDIVRRIHINSDITRAADWQLYRLKELGTAEKEVKKYIAEALKLSNEEVNRLYEEIIPKNYAHDEELYKATGKNFIPWEKNIELQQTVTALIKQTKDELVNMTQSMGFAVKMNGKVVFTPLSQRYQEIMDGAIMDIASGAFDYNTAIKRTINEMTNSGLRMVDYATGWSNRVEVATRRSVMTGINQIVGQINERNAKELETDKYEVTWHAGARNTGVGYNNHQSWQGKVYTMEELKSICGYGEGGGLKGWNCRHDFFPFIEGISERLYSDKELEDMNAKENQARTYMGKEYDTYEAIQRQRKLETLMRKQRQDIKLLESAKASEDDIINAKSKYRQSMSQYTALSKNFGLPQQMQRVYGVSKN